MSALPFLLTVGLVTSMHSSTTVLLQFDQKYSPQAIVEMKHETERILKDSGLHLDWRLLGEVRPAESFSDVIIVNFKGQCSFLGPEIPVEKGDVFARTHTSNGEVLPFTDVLCDKVSASVRSAMNGRERQRGDFLLGRALGRVLSHEIYHVVARTRDHSSTGVTRSALSGQQLVSDHMAMADSDLHKIGESESLGR